jgi:uncharacterized membrane protein
MAIKGNVKPLLMLLLIAMAAFCIFGALIGLVFSKMLLGAAIGAAIPPLWCVVAWCFLKGVDIVFRGQWG